MRYCAALLAGALLLPMAHAAEPKPFDLSNLCSSKVPHAVVCIRPADLFAQPGMDGYGKMLMSQVGELLKAKGRSLPADLSLCDIDQLILDATVDVKAHGVEKGQRSVRCGSQNFVIKMRKDVDWNAALKAIFGEVKVKQETCGTVYAVEAPAFFPGTMHLCAPDARTLVLVQCGGSSDKIDVKCTGSAAHFGAAWKQVECMPVAIGFDNRDGHWTKTLVPELSEVNGARQFIESAQTLCLGVDVSSGITGRLYVEGQNDAQATECAAALAEICKLTADKVAGETGSIGAQLAAAMLKSGKIVREGTMLRAEGHCDLTIADLLKGLDASADVKAK